MTVKLLGILNITEDSFSDGGRYLEPEAAIARADYLAANGADVIDLGAASSNPDFKAVPPDVEIARLAPVVSMLRSKRIPVSVDTFSPEVQLWALEQGVDYLNDVRGFPHAAIYDRLGEGDAKLIVMHAVQEGARAERLAVDPADIVDRVLTFFGGACPSWRRQELPGRGSFWTLGWGSSWGPGRKPPMRSCGIWKL